MVRRRGEGEKKGEAATLATPAFNPLFHPPAVHLPSHAPLSISLLPTTGETFEAKILATEAANAKFNFLKKEDPYHKYYVARVAAAKASETGGDAVSAAAAAVGKGGGGAADAAPPPLGDTAAVARAAADAAAGMVVTSAVGVPGAPPLAPPAPAAYAVRLPPGLTPLEVDTLKLTAAAAARCGEDAFPEALAKKAAGDPALAFLNPTHSLHAPFRALVAAYERCLKPRPATLARLEVDATDRTAVLARCLRRLEWERASERGRKEGAARAEAERVALLSIDWHAAVVVQAIAFAPGGDGDLPPPATKADVLAMNKAALAAAARAAAAGGNGKGGGGKAAAAPAVPSAPPPPTGQAPPTPAAPPVIAMDAEERAMVEAGAAAEVAEEDAAATAAAAAQPQPTRLLPPGAVDDDDDDGGPVRIVRDYKRPPGGATAAAAAAAAAAAQPSADASDFVVSPLTGELVRLSEMGEHMRVSLIDPRWKAQREAMLAKLRGATTAGDDEIVGNLVSLARRRPDVFGPSGGGGGGSGGSRVPGEAAAAGGGLSAAAAAAVLAAPPPPGPAPPSSSWPPPPPRAPMPPPPGPTVPVAAAAAPRARPPPPPGPTVPVAPWPPPPPGAVAPPPLAPPPPPLAEPGPAAVGAEPSTAAPPPAKRARPARPSFVLTPEEDFLAAHGGRGAGPVTIAVALPIGDPPLDGRTLTLSLPLTATLGELKAALQPETGIPPNKQKLSRDGLGVMGADGSSLAHYNLGGGVVVEFGVKTRGRRG
jgi:splicing factor 3A subunit 1